MHGTVSRNSRWDVDDYIPPIFRKYVYKLAVFYNAYLRHVMMGWICLSSVCEASSPMMRKRRQLARLPNVLLLFVQINSRKRGPWSYSLTCRPVLTQLLVPKTKRENGETYSALNTPTASANPGPSPSLCQCCWLWIILPHRQK